MNKIYVIGDIHCRNFYKPILQVKDTPVVFLGDYMDKYWYEGTTDVEGIENLKEIFSYARNNKNVILLAGNHDHNEIWSPLAAMRTSMEYYQELHKLYRDNIDLLHPIYKIKDTVFTHAGINRGWINTQNDIFKREGRNFQLNQDNIIPYIENEWTLELQNDKVPNQHFLYPSMNSSIFDIGRSRGGEAMYAGPFWSDFYGDFFGHPDGFNFYQIVGHTQLEFTGSMGLGDGLACIDSRAIFEYDLDTHHIKPSEINDEKTKSEIQDYCWKGGFIQFDKDY